MLLVSVYLILLFPLIVVSFSPSLFFISLCVAPVAVPLSSCLGCIPPLIGLPSLRLYAVSSSLFLLPVCFCLCFLFYRDDVLCWLLSCPFSSVCFPCLSPISGLVWFGSVYLVTTAGFVTDQLMGDKQQTTTISLSSPYRRCHLPLLILTPLWHIIWDGKSCRPRMISLQVHPSPPHPRPSLVAVAGPLPLPASIAAGRTNTPRLGCLRPLKVTCP